MIARVARFAVVLALAFAAPAAASPEPCERPSEPEDVSLEVEGDIATIVIQNKRDRCHILFKSMMRFLGETNMTMGTTVRIMSQTNEGLSVTDPANPEAITWMPRREFGNPLPKSLRLVLKDGQAYREPLYLAKIVRDIAVQRTANKLPDLPWGQAVTVEISTSVWTMFKPIPLEDDFAFTKEFAPFAYRLPPRRPD